MTKRTGTFIGLLAAFAVVAAFAFPTGDRAGAETYSVECSASGYWYVAGAANPGMVSDVPCDESKPGWIFDWDAPRDGTIKFVYDGDRVATPYETASGEVRTAVREVHEQGNTRPPVNEPVADGADHEAFTFEADPSNRAVRGADGNCYREARIGGQWRRSGAYGSDAAACRKASWNAHYRSQGLPLVDPAGGTFPAGQPPARDSLGRIVTPSRLVSNLSQSTSGWATWRTGWSYAQQFTTGSLAPGLNDWVVTAVELLVSDRSSSDTGTPTFTVTIREPSGGAPGSTVVGSLDVPEEFAAGVRTVTASGDPITLSANTDYFVVVEVTAHGGEIGLWATPSDTEDAGASPGWSIGDVYSYTNAGGAWLQNSSGRAFKIAVNGYAR